MSTKIDVNAILAKATAINNEAVAKAVAQMAEAEEKAQVDRVVSQLRRIEQEINVGVERLQAARKQEKKAKAYLRSVAEAKEQFMKDGDYAKFQKTEHQADEKYLKY